MCLTAVQVVARVIFSVNFLESPVGEPVGRCADPLPLRGDDWVITSSTTSVTAAILIFASRISEDPAGCESDLLDSLFCGLHPQRFIPSGYPPILFFNNCKVVDHVDGARYCTESAPPYLMPITLLTKPKLKLAPDEGGIWTGSFEFGFIASKVRMRRSETTSTERQPLRLSRLGIYKSGIPDFPHPRGQTRRSFKFRRYAPCFVRPPAFQLPRCAMLSILFTALSISTALAHFTLDYPVSTHGRDPSLTLSRHRGGSTCPPSPSSAAASPTSGRVSLSPSAKDQVSSNFLFGADRQSG